MQGGIYLAVAGQRVIQNQLVVVANNVANASTAGYKADGIAFEAVLSNAEPDLLTFPIEGKDKTDLRVGPMTPTGNPLDMAINGDGWFAIQVPGGNAYTRDGRMTIDADGQLLSITGHPILDAGGGNIIVDPAGGPLTIYTDGRIEQDGNPRGNVGVFNFDEQQIVSRFENSGFLINGEAQPIAPGRDSRVFQGMIEGSNVNAVMEMARLMELTRMFESVSKLISDADGAMSRSIREMRAQS